MTHFWFHCLPWLPHYIGHFVGRRIPGHLVRGRIDAL